MSSPLDAILRPKSVAVVGASARQNSLSYQILHNLIEYGFTGLIYPVNPKAQVLHSMKCYSSVAAIPEPVDLAILVVPRDAVLEAVDDCGRKGVKGLVVITAGFKETGPEGAKLEAELKQKLGIYGMRMVGPNCMGVINTDPDCRLDATFSPTFPLDGNAAFVSQSGALGVVILNLAREVNLGLSYFISMGNKTDTSGNDFLEYWAEDPRTNLILMYLESFGNPRKFVQITRALTKQKPILVVKSGRTVAGARAAVSHTGALAGTDVLIDAMLDQCGVIRAGSVEELFDLGIAFAKNPLPEGNRVAVLTNAGGPAILATDALVGHGLKMASLLPETTRRLKQRLPAEAAVINPVDMLPAGDAPMYEYASDLLLRDPGVDSLVVVFVPPLMVHAMDVARAVESVRRRYAKPMVGVFMAPEEFRAELRQAMPDHMPMYPFPEAAARGLAALERYRHWRAKPLGQVRHFHLNRERVATVFERVRAAGRAQLHLDEAFAVAEACGIPLARYKVCHSAEAAEKAAAEIGLPVALKIASGDVVHKTEAGGVALGLATAEQVTRAYAGMVRQAHHKLAPPGGEGRVIVQAMVPGGLAPHSAGRETILGVTADPHYGPVLMFGLGGIFVETLRDVVFRMVPITDADADEMIRQIRGHALLEGVRGQPPVAFGILRESLERLSQLVAEFPETVEVDINPFFASPDPQMSRAVDVRIRINL